MWNAEPDVLIAGEYFCMNRGAEVVLGHNET